MHGTGEGTESPGTSLGGLHSLDSGEHPMTGEVPLGFVCFYCAGDQTQGLSLCEANIVPLTISQPKEEILFSDVV